MMFKAFRYLEDGEFDTTDLINASDLDSAVVAHFADDVSRLSGDLELPMERPVPEMDHLEYRIVSDLKGGAFVLYYFHDELIMAALLLQGRNDGPERDLLEVFKYLLLEPEGVDEEEGPSEEEIDDILTSGAFDFESVTDRPATMSVVYQLEPEADDATAHTQRMNAHLAKAFFDLPMETATTEPN